ncbi:MAG: class I SAM-dependent methyltransferase [Pseudohongiella sp.]|nr:class I SAM-dependent methyltransferase [Pseudohongiella sp.]
MSESRKVPEASVDDIAAYYNKNTRLFLDLGGSGDVAAIHRAIWAPGVTNKTEAFNYLNVQVAHALQACIKEPGAHVLDLGCGVGGTSTWLASALNADVTGITISAEQQRLATQRAELLGLGNRVRFVQGDFAAMPKLEAADAAFAIESFVHARSADTFFEMAARHIKPGGCLVICDDFLNSSIPDQEQGAANDWIQRFQRGWHLNNLVTPDQTITSASRVGFKLLHASNLSAYTRSFNPIVLFLVSQLTRLPLPWAYWQNMAGGTALQICLRRGWTQYHVLVWQHEG